MTVAEWMLHWLGGPTVLVLAGIAALGTALYGLTEWVTRPESAPGPQQHRQPPSTAND